MGRSATIIHPSSITSSAAQGSGIYLGGPNYGLIVVKSQWMDAADIQLHQLKKGDRDGSVLDGFTRKPKVLIVNCRVKGVPTAIDPTAAADVQRKIDRINRVLAPDRGELFWKFDWNQNLATSIDRMVLSRVNGPIISTIKGGGLSRVFQINLIIPSGVSHGIELQTQGSISIAADPTTFFEPLSASAVVFGNKPTFKLAIIDILNTGAFEGSNITIENKAVDLDGNQVTSGVIRWRLGLGADYTLRILLEERLAQWKHVVDTSGVFVDNMAGLSIGGNTFPSFVNSVRNEIEVSGIPSATVTLQYLPEYI